MQAAFTKLRNTLRVATFYARGVPQFVMCLLEPGLSIRFGRHARFGGEKLPYFFVGKRIPLSSLRIGSSTIEDSRAYQRVVELLAHYPAKPEGSHFMGRDVDRMWELVESRMNGTDSFAVLVERTSRGHYRLIDGATRVALLAATGATETSVFVTTRSP
jgi:hypothetical protein